MDLKLLIWIILISFTVAQTEIQIEGKDGWAKNLPTWRIKNKLTDLLFNGNPLTGYHFWMFSSIFLLFHTPFIFNLNWSLKNELAILASYTFFLVIEDFLWFVLNPNYGIRKFNKVHVTWHKNWIGPVPSNYPVGIIFTLLLFILSNIV